jgi:hypothetical protein
MNPLINSPTPLESFVLRHRDTLDSVDTPPSVWLKVNQTLDQNPPQTDIWFDNNRHALDTEMPSAQVWQQIALQLPKIAKKKRFFSVNWQQSVAAAALVGVGLFAGLQLGQNNEDKLDIAKYAPHYAEAQRVFDQKSVAIMKELESHPQARTVANDLKQYDLHLLELQKVIEEAPISARPELIRRLIEQYQNKIQILEQALNSTHRGSSQQSPSHDFPTSI